MNKKIKALVVDDHPLVAQATKSLLEEIEDIEVTAVAGNAEQCMEQVALCEPHLVFLDYQLPDMPGTEVVKQIKARYPNTHIVIFTGIDTSNLFNAFVNLQVSGILSKESSVRTIKNMVNCILDNHTMLPVSLFQSMLGNTVAINDGGRLTEEEIVIMNLLVKGATHDQIAEQIYMSKRTVDNYLKKIYDKLGAQGKIESIEKFIQSNYYGKR